MPAAASRADQTVTWADLARALGIPRTTRQRILSDGLVTPVRPPHPGQQTEITREDAETVGKAVMIAAATGVGLIIVLKLLASGAVRPNVP
jgi:hypothetical protein